MVVAIVSDVQFILLACFRICYETSLNCQWSQVSISLFFFFFFCPFNLLIVQSPFLDKYGIGFILCAHKHTLSVSLFQYFNNSHHYWMYIAIFPHWKEQMNEWMNKRDEMNYTFSLKWNCGAREWEKKRMKMMFLVPVKMCGYYTFTASIFNWIHNNTGLALTWSFSTNSKWHFTIIYQQQCYHFGLVL